MVDKAVQRGASGHGSIIFRQNLKYPQEPNQITYYPPEPSEGLKRQVASDKAGGITLYIIGFMVALVGFMVALDYSQDMEIYSTLIPFLLVLGLVFAVMFLILNNVVLAKLARTMPFILLIALVLLYVFSIIDTVTDLSDAIDAGDDAAIDAFMETLFEKILNPSFFLLAAGLIIARAGGTMLWTSTKVVHQYIPGTIILEVPGYIPPADEYGDELEEEPVGETQPAEIENPCINCGAELSFIEDYGRWYCYECKEYAPKDKDAPRDSEA